jgi:hypothetical protein
MASASPDPEKRRRTVRPIERPIEPRPRFVLAHRESRRPGDRGAADWASPVAVTRPATGAREHYLACRHCRRPVTCTVLSAADTARSRRGRAAGALASLACLGGSLTLLTGPVLPVPVRAVIAGAAAASLVGVVLGARGWLLDDGIRVRDDPATPADQRHVARARPRGAAPG